jgi:hypothetical protein
LILFRFPFFVKNQTIDFFLLPGVSTNEYATDQAVYAMDDCDFVDDAGSGGSRSKRNRSEGVSQNRQVFPFFMALSS